jgi:hypothetical protein
MTTDNKPGIILILIFAALISFVIFLIFKRRSNGLLGNKFLISGAIVGAIVFFLLAKDQMADYYQQVFKDAPYAFSELKSVVFKYGESGNLINQYNSATGEYQYVDKRDSLVKSHLYLSEPELLYLHHKAAELGFWDFPSNEVNTDTTNTNGVKVLEYSIQFNYQHKSKTVLFSANYNGPEQLDKANRQLIQEIQTVLSAAEKRQR